MNINRLNSLANLLDALQREQEEAGFPLFTIGSEDRISQAEAKEIVAAVKDRVAATLKRSA